MTVPCSRMDRPQGHLGTVLLAPAGVRFAIGCDTDLRAGGRTSSPSDPVRRLAVLGGAGAQPRHAVPLTSNPARVLMHPAVHPSQVLVLVLVRAGGLEGAAAPALGCRPGVQAGDSRTAPSQLPRSRLGRPCLGRPCLGPHLGLHCRKYRKWSEGTRFSLSAPGNQP